MNKAAIDKGGDYEKVEVPAEWSKLVSEKASGIEGAPDFVNNVVLPINSLKGDDLPVSAFLDREDGTFPSGTTEYEKRGIAVHVPEWIHDN
jgi:pyruvate-ferredoxin/flavodoxin oxidoreductase